MTMDTVLTNETKKQKHNQNNNLLIGSSALMVIVGIISIIVPNFIGIGFNTFVGGVFVISAALQALNLYSIEIRNSSLFYKPFLLALFALVILLNTSVNVAVLGLLIGICFSLYGVSTFITVTSSDPFVKKLTKLNGAFVFLMGIWVIYYWPVSSAWSFSLIVGIPFVLDGAVMVCNLRKHRKTI